MYAGQSSSVLFLFWSLFSYYFNSICHVFVLCPKLTTFKKKKKHLQIYWFIFFSFKGLIFVVDSNDRERIAEAADELSKMVGALPHNPPPRQSQWFCQRNIVVTVRTIDSSQFLNFLLSENVALFGPNKWRNCSFRFRMWDDAPQHGCVIRSSRDLVWAVIELSHFLPLMWACVCVCLCAYSCLPYGL